MRIKSTLTSLAVLVAVPAIVLSSAPARAAVPSSIEGGNIYRVKNVTQGTDFSDPNNAAACDLLQYKVRIHNGGPDEILTNVTVQAAFPTAASTQNISLIILRADNASPSSTSDTATVNLSTAQKMSYVSGTTQLLDADGNVMQTLPDGITQAGVNIGSLGISINEKRFVQFEEKVNCPTPPTPPVTLPATPTKGTPPVTPAAPTSLVNTGPGSDAAIFLAATIAGTFGYRRYLSRRLSRQS